MQLLKNKKYIAGIDEAGRGPIAGPVSVGIVIVERGKESLLKNFIDSKKISERKREELFKQLRFLKKDGLVFYKNSLISNKTIDKKGIIFAINKGIENCLKEIYEKNLEIFLDGGLNAPKKFLKQKTIIKGDSKVKVISAASIVAKVLRDKKMISLSKKYPGYDLEKHKGYGTKNHYKKIKLKGCSSLHRKTFIH